MLDSQREFLDNQSGLGHYGEIVLGLRALSDVLDFLSKAVEKST